MSGFLFQNLFSACFMSQQYGANHDGMKLNKLYKSSNIFQCFSFFYLSMIMEDIHVLFELMHCLFNC